MKKFILLFVLSTFLLAFTQIEKGTIGDSPGTIQAIGNAGSDNIFTFQKWKFTSVEMADDQVENIKLGIEVNTSSLTCDWKDLEKNIRKKKDYFYVKKFPKAIISIDGATALEDGKYQTTAMLTLKKHTKPVELTFTISEEKPYKIKGTGMIIRQDFGFNGGGPEDEVPVMFEVELPL